MKRLGNKRFIILIVFAGFIVFLFYKNDKIIVTPADTNRVKSFDLIVSSGQSVQSRLLKLLDISQNSYSHIGIIIKRNNKAFVLHATPDGTPDNAIRFDDLQTFINLSDVNFYTILRPRKPLTDTTSLYRQINHYRLTHIPFDYNFDNFDKTKIYCSELVYDIYSKSRLIHSELNLNKPLAPKIFIQLKDFKIVLNRKAQ